MRPQRLLAQGPPPPLGSRRRWAWLPCRSVSEAISELPAAFEGHTSQAKGLQRPEDLKEDLADNIVHAGGLVGSVLVAE